MRTDTSFLDCSGSPPILVPFHVASEWRGITNPISQSPSDLNLDDPQTDYDRACAACYTGDKRDGNAVLQFMGYEALVIYTESDWHVWLEEMGVIVCEHWIPDRRLVESANWTDPLIWKCSEDNPILLNSAADGSDGLIEGEDFLKTSLCAGFYKVETASISDGTYGGIVHRFCLVEKVSK